MLETSRGQPFCLTVSNKPVSNRASPIELTASAPDLSHTNSSTDFGFGGIIPFSQCDGGVLRWSLDTPVRPACPRWRDRRPRLATFRPPDATKIFQEQVSSVAERQQLEAALDYVREGDTFACHKLDRLARSVGDLLAIVARLETKEVSLRVLSISGNQPLDTSTSTGRLMLSVKGAVGQAEREAMLERQREGIARAKAQNRYKGRVPTARRQSAEIIRLKMQASGPRKSPASWVSAGRACIGC